MLLLPFSTMIFSIDILDHCSAYHKRNPSYFHSNDDAKTDNNRRVFSSIVSYKNPLLANISSTNGNANNYLSIKTALLQKRNYLLYIHLLIRNTMKVKRKIFIVLFMFILCFHFWRRRRTRDRDAARADDDDDVPPFTESSVLSSSGSVNRSTRYW